ncbi:uncharacterized protein LOC130628667 [Hydractinia symbiolongicarpus]|uniref:uncharacterized protein LOC130628667 n=1 Tax=Hydractinia symbiolongicarpus TaxID=13093 RepID=UPI00254CB198|nr:uncharacterized protein LOC130628667 [Hydractinia symbiolongicarpus]
MDCVLTEPNACALGGRIVALVWWRRQKMPDSCCAVGCSNKRKKGGKLKFYCIPFGHNEESKKLRQLWQEIFQKEKEGIQKELSTARVELLELKNEVVQPLENASSTKFPYDTVVAENRLNFYTGITTPGLFEWFLSLFVRKVRYFSEKLSHNDHLLLVLMKLKLGLLNKDLAYRFGLSETVASRIYRRWIPIISKETCHLIIWPDREAWRRHLSNSFKKNFQNCTCIIAERPYNLNARAHTWSNYKNTCTMKYLIGITPAGLLAFCHVVMVVKFLIRK